jgi:CRISPR-associated endonuclease/helicase Cas3
VVLVPPGDGEGLEIPDRWVAVYDRSLLQRTRTLLATRGGRDVRIPQDVQGMVEEVYDETFSAELSESELARRMDDEVRYNLADLVAIPAPAHVADLSVLTSKEIVEDEISTRLGADSVRVVCCFVDERGTRWLDAACSVPLPEAGSGQRGRFTAADTGTIRMILGESIPVPDGPWRGQDRDVTALPGSWADHPSLRDLLLLPHPIDADGNASPVGVGGRRFLLDPILGLTW